ncbi:MAG: hypothetical protein GF341_12920 [candidate division Zixibacteria bacterium]|nr:hypothetical protein [candidate division Zixibacteria bacterium]
MPKFLIEIPHSEDIYECARAIKVFLESGSHFLVNAEWGCEDGVHNCWLMLEADNHDQARGVVPPAYRADATVVRLNRFEWQQVDNIMKAHHKEA